MRAVPADVSREQRARCLAHPARTRGAVALENTQPFARELGGRLHLFAHNGDLPRVERIAALGPAQPLGDTDSERAFSFCSRASLRSGVARRACRPASRIDSPRSRRSRASCACWPANFLYSDGEMLFAHADRRKQRGGEIAPPGLWLLRRSCPVEPDASSGVSIAAESGPQEVALIASVPLSSEPWEPLAPGELLAIEHGAVVARVAPSEVRGLSRGSSAQNSPRKSPAWKPTA